MAITLPAWTWRVVIGVVALVGVVWVLLAWFHANQIRSEFLIPRPALEGFPLTVEGNDAGRITVTRSTESEREGVWGLEGEQAYAQVGTIVRLDESTVERGVRTQVGVFAPGDPARIDPDAYAGTPDLAHGIAWEPIVTPSEIGPHTGWFIDGRRATWVVFVHGMGNDRLPESLRLIPSLVEQGFPVMVLTYRNDIGATANESGMRLWGLEEWRDLEAAAELAVRKGAKDLVFFGSGFGASIVSTFLHESDAIGFVRGAIYETPVIDLESVVIRWSGERSVPGPIAWLGRRLATVRFGVEWDLLDQMERIEEFDVPMLLFVGGEDPVSYPTEIESFADQLGDLADEHRFEQAGHTDLWNIDADRYEAIIEQWLVDLLGPE